MASASRAATVAAGMRNYTTMKALTYKKVSISVRIDHLAEARRKAIADGCSLSRVFQVALIAMLGIGPQRGKPGRTNGRVSLREWRAPR